MAKATTIQIDIDGEIIEFELTEQDPEHPFTVAVDGIANNEPISMEIGITARLV